MATYLELKAQAETLLRQAEEARLAELQSVLDEVRVRVAEYGLTPDQVFGRKRAVRKDASTKAAVSVAKYRDPKTGTTWCHGSPYRNEMNGPRHRSELEGKGLAGSDSIRLPRLEDH